jgi:8-oxo-dGTP pyrophosphatase MutT (NUDIX family)
MNFSGKGTGRKRIQYAALPYRVNGDARPEVMLVTSRETRRWIIPKGWPHRGKTPRQSAACEAFEEAGVVGAVGRRPIGSFSYRKQLKRGVVVDCEVRVFALKVKRQCKSWPEQGQRRSAWHAPGDAARLIREPHLRQIIRKFAERG